MKPVPLRPPAAHSSFGWLSAALGLLAAFSVEGAWAAAPSGPAPVRMEAWYDFFFHGKKVGFLYALDEPSSLEGRPVVHSLRKSLLTVRRRDEVIRMESVTDAWCELDGSPIRFAHTRDEGGSKRKIDGWREGAQLKVRIDVGGTLTEKRTPAGRDVYFTANLDYVFKRNLHEKKRLVAQGLIEEEGELAQLTIRVEGTETTKEGTAFVVIGDLAGVTSKELVLADGRTLRTKVDRVGAEFVLTTKERAIAELDPTDLFTAARILTKVQLPSTDAIDRLTVRLSSKSGRPPAPILDGRQALSGKPKKDGSPSLDLLIRSVEPPKKAPLERPKDAKLERFLKSTPYEALDDERLVTASKRAVGDAKDAWQAARRINAFVHSHIRTKSLSQAFSTAVEALVSGEGDCTEHSVLFSALAKIAGVPTRLVTGLVYVGTAEGVFGYHEWVEVWLGGHWVPMDPTFGQDLADPTHIKFTEGLSDSDGLRQTGVVAAELFGDLDLTVVEYSIDGKKVRL